MTSLAAFFFAVACTVLAPVAHAGSVVRNDPEGDQHLVASTPTVPGDWTQLVGPASAHAQGPGPRTLPSAIYDPDGDRMVVFGGIFYSEAYSEVWTTSLATTGAWQCLNAGPGPSGRRDQVAVYDSARKRMLVYGGSGYEDAALGDVWALALADSPSWSEITPTGPQPPARFSHAGIYDPVRDQLVVFGGYTGTQFDNSVWALSLSGTPQWTQLAPEGDLPSARDAMTAVYDPVRDRMLVFGGWAETQFDGNVWALSLSGTPTWTRLATAGSAPSPRRHYEAVYDATKDRLLVWGGLDDNGYRNDLHALSLGDSPTWSDLAPTGDTPAARDGGRAVYDPVRNRMVAFGGYGAAGYLGDLSTLSLSGTPAWASQRVESPDPVRDQVAVYDSNHNRMLVYGGSAWSDSPNSDTWALSLDAVPAWSSIHATGPAPPARFSHAGMYDPVRDRLLVFGGWTGTAFVNDVWALDLSGPPAWSHLQPDGTPPSARDAMTTLYDSVQDRLVVFGGWAADHFVNDLWQLSLSGTPTWSPVPTTGTPPSPRRHYAAAFDAATNRVVLTGGLDDTGFRDDTWTLRFDADGSGTWVQENPTGGTPSPRNGHRAVLDAAHNRLLVFGGYDGAYRCDLWELSLDGGMAWHPIRSGGTFHPDARMLHTCVFAPAQSRLILFGGLNQGYAMSDVWAFDASAGDTSSATRSGDSGLPSPGNGQAQFAISRVSPNPATGPFDVHFSLADSRPASLLVYSIAGRELFRREVGSLGAGEHAVNFAPAGRMAPGVYLVRLRGVERAVDSKVVVAGGR